MTNTSEIRQLAAIMFTDIVGYTEMMGEDENRTREILRKQREIIFPIVEKSDGKVLKEMGDGLLIMFKSAKKAVKCGLEIQNTLKDFTLRIGIHIGDVVIENGDVFGSGVNIAARVESLTPPGSICITSDVWNQINNQTGLDVESLGFKEIKGVNQPIEIYEVIPHTIKKNRKVPEKGKSLLSLQSSVPDADNQVNIRPKKSLYLTIIAAILLVAILFYYQMLPSDVYDDYGQSIAVLPLQNLSPDPDDAFFTDGVHEDIITQLTKIENLKVIGRTSVVSYLPESRDIRKIAGELGVNTVMEGSVRRSGERIRVAVQLIDVNNSRALWAESFERNLDDLFNIQSEIAREIASALQINLRPSEKKQIELKPTNDPLAYELYLRAREYELRPGYVVDNMQIAENLYERAIAQDPDFASAYARLSILSSTIYWFNADYSNERIHKIITNAEHALLLVPDLTEGLYAMGLYYYWVIKDYKTALEKLNIALQQQPSNSDLINTIGAVQRRMGLWDESISNMKKAVELNPRISSYMYQISLSYSFNREFENSIEWMNRALELTPDFYLAEIGKYNSELMLTGDLEAYRINIARLSYLEYTNPQFWWFHNLIGRNIDYLLELSLNTEIEVFEGQDSYHPMDYVIGLLYMVKGNEDVAVKHLESAKVILENQLLMNQNDFRIHTTLGKVYALLGKSENALYYAESLPKLAPVTDDALIHPNILLDQAVIYSFLGDAANCVRLLEQLLNMPSQISVNYLKLYPGFDFIRDTPDFLNLIARYESKQLAGLN